MFKSALRTTARTVRSTPRTVSQRTYASSPVGSNKTGDSTWIMGSAVVFGGLSAYLLATGGTKAHPAEAAVHSTTNMKIADASGKNIRPEDAPTLVNTKAEQAHKGSGQEITHIEGADDSSSSGDDAPEPSTGSDDDDEGRKAEDIPGSELASKAAQKSQELAENVAVPAKAMANEASEKFNKASDKANEIGEKASEKVTSAFSSATSDSSDVSSSPLSRSTSSSSSGSSSEAGKMEAADEGRKAEDIPSSEIENSLHQAEEACVPKATWAHDGKAE